MLAIIQCRLRSKRLPGKVLHTFFGETILQRLIGIAQNVPSVDRVVVAYGGQYGSSIAEKETIEKKAEFFIGSEEDVSSRFVQLASSSLSPYIARMTCDNYLIQPALVENLYQMTVSGDYSYGYVEPLSHYCGEIIKSKELLEYFSKGNKTHEDCEHVTPGFRKYIREHSLILPCDLGNLDHSRSKTLDTLEDLLHLKYLEREYPALKGYNCLDVLQRITQ